MKKRFEEGDLVISFNSRLELFSKKLRSCWWGPFKFTKVQPNGAVEVWNESIEAFIVNGQQLKPYFMGQPIEKTVIYTLSDSIHQRRQQSRS